MVDARGSLPGCCAQASSSNSQGSCASIPVPHPLKIQPAQFPVSGVRSLGLMAIVAPHSGAIPPPYLEDVMPPDEPSTTPL